MKSFFIGIVGDSRPERRSVHERMVMDLLKDSHKISNHHPRSSQGKGVGAGGLGGGGLAGCIVRGSGGPCCCGPAPALAPAAVPRMPLATLALLVSLFLLIELTSP